MQPMTLEQKVIVAVGTHPDDYEWGCGATLMRHLADGYRVMAIIMTYGQKGEHPEDGSEAIKAAQFLGIPEHDVLIAPFTDGQIKAKDAADFLRENMLKGTSRLYAPVAFDSHIDHINTAIAAQRAARFAPQTQIYLYQGPGNAEFIPDIRIGTTETDLRQKIKAYGAHISQSARIKDLDKKMLTYEDHWRQFLQGEELRKKMDFFRAQEQKSPFGALFYGTREWAEHWGKDTACGLAEAFEIYIK
jgi:LmbE family N-acetylglucosaminyl deacetylase